MVALTGTANAQKKKKEATTYIATAKELGQEFGAAPARAKAKYGETKAHPAAKIDVDGIVKSVDEKESTVTLVADKLEVVIKTKKISGEKEGQRVAIAKGALYKDFIPKKSVVLECDEVKLEKLPVVKD
jgi:hypothetical protein